jgi:lipopolysaccharide transport system permease protein
MNARKIIPSNPNNEKDWTMVIRPRRAWWDLRLGELWHYRDLVWLLVWRDFVAVYKQTVLGPIWHFIQPIVATMVYTIAFGKLAKLPTDGLPPFLFYMAGNTLWSYFSVAIAYNANTFVSNAAIFGKVYFPRLIIPISVVTSNLISFTIRFAIFLVFWAYYLMTGSEIHPNVYALLLPILLLLMAGIGMGVGIIFSSLTTKYRDVQQLLGLGMQFLMYASPVLYPLSIVPAEWRWILLINPFTPILEVFRLGFLGSSGVNPLTLFYSAGFTVVVLSVGILMFNSAENTFLDTV